MANPVDGQTIRRVLLEVLDEYSRKRPDFLHIEATLQEAAQRLGLHDNMAAEQALLTLFYDLFRTGHLSWGLNLANAGPPRFHLTDQSRQTLQHLSRDPANPDGYSAHLARQGSLNPIANSYIQEALRAYNSDCFKATAVMVGAAAESLILDLREVLVTRINALGHTPPKDLADWRVKRILDALKKALDLQKSAMPSKLAEAFESYWPAFTQQIRATRNDAGHPSSIDPVTPETVHASLLIFPELVKLGKDLQSWISGNYA
jgi:hypothetical protein